MKISTMSSLLLLTAACGAAEPLDKLQAQISFSPAEVDFLPATVLQSQTADLTVVNAGTGVLHVNQINLVDPTGDFLITAHELTVQPNSKAVVQISFTPGRVGQATADLQLVYDVEPGSSIVTLSGTGVAPDQQAQEGEGEQQATGEGEGEVVMPNGCQTQDDCQMNASGRACAPDHTCRQICRRDSQCGSQACRPLPGSTSIGYCDTAGSVAEGGACSSNSQCRVGLCSEGVCREICQRQDQCGAAEECGAAFYQDSVLGRRMTTACQPVGSREEISQSCLSSPSLADSGLCASNSCDMLPWAYGLSSQAGCSAVCAGAGDCGADQVCGIIYTGMQEQPAIGGTGEGPGRYIDAYTGCYTPVDFFSGNYDTIPPGNQVMGGSCSDDFDCRSFMCAGFAPIVNKCTDFCSSDSDCNTPQTPGWHCRVAELNHASLFLQRVQIADVSKFSLVGVCAP